MHSHEGLRGCGYGTKPKTKHALIFSCQSVHMPRIIPRLLKQLNTQHASEQRYIPFDIKAIRKPRKSIYAAVEGRPPLQSTHFQKSILLNPVNPVTQSRRYARHKTFPPRVYIPRNAKSRQNENDQPRYMSIDELAWGASPYRTSQKGFIQLSGN